MKPWLTPKRLNIAGALYLALCAIGGVLLVEISLHPPTLRPVDDAAQKRAAEIAARAGGTVESVALETIDLTPLKAWLLVPDVSRRNGTAVVLLHGVSDSRVGVLGFAPFLLARGYTLLLPDARAHGHSGGRATYGLLERQDVRAWARWLAARHSGHCVYGLGASMGAAMLLQSLDGNGSEFCAVVADSSFADFKEVAFDRVGQPFGFGPLFGKTLARPLLEAAFAYAHWQYGYRFADASPRNAIASSPVPVFLIHGAADVNVPLRHVRLLQHARPSLKVWLVDCNNHL